MKVHVTRTCGTHKTFGARRNSKKTNNQTDAIGSTRRSGVGVGGAYSSTSDPFHIGLLATRVGGDLREPPPDDNVVCYRDEMYEEIRNRVGRYPESVRTTRVQYDGR